MIGPFLTYLGWPQSFREKRVLGPKREIFKNEKKTPPGIHPIYRMIRPFLTSLGFPKVLGRTKI